MGGTLSSVFWYSQYLTQCLAWSVLIKYLGPGDSLSDSTCRSVASSLGKRQGPKLVGKGGIPGLRTEAHGLSLGLTLYSALRPQPDESVGCPYRHSLLPPHPCPVWGLESAWMHRSVRFCCLWESGDSWPGRTGSLVSGLCSTLQNIRQMLSVLPPRSPSPSFFSSRGGGLFSLLSFFFFHTVAFQCCISFYCTPILILEL